MTPELTARMEALNKKYESVCLKLIYKITKQMDDQPPNEFGYKAHATYPYLRDECYKAAECTMGIFGKCLAMALKQQVIWEINGLYTTKRPSQRTLDDEWDY